MAKIYVKRIKEGTMTLEQVPSKWRAEVEALLSE